MILAMAACLAVVPAVTIIRFFTEVKMIETVTCYCLHVAIAGIALHVMTKKYVISTRAQVPFSTAVLAAAIAVVLFALFIMVFCNNFFGSFINWPILSLYEIFTKHAPRESYVSIYALSCLANGVLLGGFIVWGAWAGTRKYLREKQEREAARA